VESGSRSRIVLAVRNADGHREDVDVPGPGGTIRIAVGRAGCHSGVWRIWAGPNQSDVYVSARVLAGKLKFSLHESGDWRLQWLSKAQATQYANTESRIIDQWPSPSSGPGGWTKGLTVWVPGQDIVDIPDDRHRLDGVDWLPAPATNVAIGVHVVIAETGHGFVPVTGAAPFAGFWLADGRVVLVVVSAHRLDAGARAWLDERRAAARVAVRAKGDPGSGTRMAVFGSHTDGSRAVWDLAWD
jgi:hypothetical protein